MKQALHAMARLITKESYAVWILHDEVPRLESAIEIVPTMNRDHIDLPSMRTC